VRQHGFSPLARIYFLATVVIQFKQVACRNNCYDCSFCRLRITPEAAQQDGADYRKHRLAEELTTASTWTTPVECIKGREKEALTFPRCRLKRLSQG
jgi:hypothetical protein